MIVTMIYIKSKTLRPRSLFNILVLFDIQKPEWIDSKPIGFWVIIQNKTHETKNSIRIVLIATPVIAHRDSKNSLDFLFVNLTNVWILRISEKNLQIYYRLNSKCVTKNEMTFIDTFSYNSTSRYWSDLLSFVLF